jgi:hypothetical protein
VHARHHRRSARLTPSRLRDLLPKELLQTVPPTIDPDAVGRMLASAFPPA